MRAETSFTTLSATAVSEPPVQPTTVTTFVPLVKSPTRLLVLPPYAGCVFAKPVDYGKKFGKRALVATMEKHASGGEHTTPQQSGRDLEGLRCRFCSVVPAFVHLAPMGAGAFEGPRPSINQAPIMSCS